MSERRCQECKFSGMDMDLDPYCANPEVLKRMPYGQTLCRPVPECPKEKNRPLWEPRK